MNWAELNKSIGGHAGSMGKEKGMLEDFWRILENSSRSLRIFADFCRFLSTGKTKKIQAPKKCLFLQANCTGMYIGIGSDVKVQDLDDFRRSKEQEIFCY